MKCGQIHLKWCQSLSFEVADFFYKTIAATHLKRLQSNSTRGMKSGGFMRGSLTMLCTRAGDYLNIRQSVHTNRPDVQQMNAPNCNLSIDRNLKIKDSLHEL